jgi:hypothetical protein
MRTLFAGLLFLAVIWVADSNAEDDNNQHSQHNNHYSRWACVSQDFFGNCLRYAHRQRVYTRYHHHRHQHHRRHTDNDDNGHRRHAKHDDRELGALCHNRRRVVGEERTSKALARKSSDDAWMGAVRYDHGERYQDLNHAKDVRHNCDPSSTSSILKRVHFRCVIEATPCRERSATAEERYERRYEETDDDDDDDNKGKRNRK